MNEIVRINHGDYTAEINISKGANCISLKNTRLNADIIREPDYTGALDNPFVYGMPILYPVNRIQNGCFEFENRKYTFPINEPETQCHLHGELHAAEFELAHKEESSVKCIYEGQYPGFPHKFRIEMMYLLNDKGLTHAVEIANLSDASMPNFLGFHTTFNIPFIKGSAAGDIVMYADVGDEIERSPQNYLPTGTILAPDKTTWQLKQGSFRPGGTNISRHFKVRSNGEFRLTDKKRSVSLVYRPDEKFSWRMIFGNGEYICAEPMTCMVNCQNSPFEREYAVFDFITPGAAEKYVSEIYLEEMI